MKIFKKYSGTPVYILFIAVMFNMLIAANAHAMIPSLDILVDGFKVTEKIMKGLTRIQAAKNQYIDGTQSTIKGFATKLVQMKTGVDTEDPMERVPGAKEVKFSCDIADVEDIGSVKQAVYDLFLVNPIYEINDRFYQDNVIQAYTVATHLEERLKELDLAVDELYTLLTEGGNGAEAAEDANATWRNAQRAYNTLNKIIQIWQEFSAIEGEYLAARLIRTNAVDPLPAALYQKQSSLTDDTQKFASSETLVFAQLTRFSSAEAPAADEKVDIYETGVLSFGEMPEAPIASPFDANRDKLKELAKLDPILEKVNHALDAHNVIQSLPSHKSIFIDYERAIARHNRSIEMLQLSEQCVLGHLGNYYDDPVKVWSGVKLGDHVYAHELRRGLSGWAVNAFSVAKASKPNVANEDDAIEAQLAYDGDSNDLTSIEKQNHPESSNSMSSGKVEEIEKSNREVELIPWNIGSEAAKMLAEDQYTGANKWGIPKKKFPLWNDQKSFYNQYIDGKYSNIIDYLKFIDLRGVALNVAEDINDTIIKNPVTKAEYKKYIELIKDNLKLNTEDFNDNKDIEAIQNERKNVIAREVARKNQQVAAEKTRRERIYAQIESLTAELEKLNIEYNKGQQDIQDAESRVTGYNDDIEIAKQRYGDDDLTKVSSETESAETTASRMVEVDPRDYEYNTQSQTKEVAPNVWVEPMAGQNLGTPTYLERKTVVETEPGEIEVIEESESAPITGTKTTTTTTTYQELKAPVLADEAVAAEPEASVDMELQPAAIPQSGAGTGFRKRPDVDTGGQSSYLQITEMAFAQLLDPGVDEVVVTEEEVELGEETAVTTTVIQGEGYSDVTETVEVVPAVVSEPEIPEGTAREQTIEITEFTDEVVEAPATEVSAEFTIKTDVGKDIKLETRDEIIAGFKSDIAHQKGLAEAAKAKAPPLDAKIKEKEARINTLKKTLQEIDENIKKIEDEHIQKVFALETAYDQKITAAIGNYQKLREQNIAGRKSLHDVYNSIIKPIILAKPSVPGIPKVGLEMSFEDLILDSEKVMNGTVEYAVAAVNKAREDMYALGDDLYFPHSNPTVVERHKLLMLELRTMTATDMGAFSQVLAKYLPQGNIATLATTAFSQVMLEKACAADGCHTADNEYFVGYYGKTKDFKAPNAPPALYLPNVREIIHLDRIDYANINKDSKGNTSKEAFMAYGTEIPKIWTMILDENIFVEKPVDLQSILSLGGEAVLFMSGGRYPCNIDSHVVNIDAFQNRFIISKKQQDDEKNPNCTDLKLKFDLKPPKPLNPLGPLHSISPYVITDIESDLEAPTLSTTATRIMDILFLKFNQESAKLADSTSELGIFLGIAKKNTLDVDRKESTFNVTQRGTLFINEIPRKAFEKLDKVDAEQSKDTKFEPKIEDELYKKAIFDHNQIGNFLDFVETEQVYRQAKDELETGIDELRAELIELLSRFDLEVNADINLADQKEYDMLRNQLDRIKNQMVSEGLALIGEVVVANNEIVEQRLNRLKNTYNSLQKDKNEIVSLTDTTDSGPALDEAIKTEEANQKVANEKADEAEESFQQSLKTFPRPYCAAY